MRRAVVLALVIVAIAALAYLVPFVSNGGNGEPATSPVDATGGRAPTSAQPATVNYVHDGDTIFLDTAQDDNLKVRLLAIDTPEVGENAECLGDEARDWLRNALPEGSTVYTLADADETDQYGRALLFVWTADGSFVNLELVADGYAEAVFIGNNRLYQSAFETAEADARNASLGIWGNC